MSLAITRRGEPSVSGPNFTSRSEICGWFLSQFPKSSSTIGRMSGFGHVAQHTDVHLAAFDELLGERLVLKLLANLPHPLGQVVPASHQGMPPDAQRRIRLGGLHDQRKVEPPMRLERFAIEGSEFGVFTSWY